MAEPNPFQKFKCPSSHDGTPTSPVPAAAPSDATPVAAGNAPEAAVAQRQRSPLLAENPDRRKRSRATPTSTEQSAPKGLVEKLGSKPLRLIIVGHNPSEQAWAQGHYYANPGNHMWRILRETGIAPEQIRGAQDDDLMASLAGVGFTDVGTGTPGTVSADFGPKDFKVWAVSFYQRLAQHLADACSEIGCTCGTCGAPAIVVFGGKRHFTELLKLPPPPGQPRAAAPGRRGGTPQVQLGVQQQLPAGWPLPASTEVWVTTSTSGASALTREARLAPWKELSERLQQVPWPRQLAPTCAASGAAAAQGAADSAGDAAPGGDAAE